MDEQARTIFCGNLSNEVTEDILYELFLQAGPIEKVSIPKDRDGRQRAFGFITYKHMNSVKYALHLFEGTKLYNRALSMKPRYNAEAQQVDNTANYNMRNMMQLQLQQQNMHNMYNMHNTVQLQLLQKNQLLQQTQQLGLGNFPLLDTNSSNDDKNLKRMHPYQRDRDKHRERDKIRDRDRDRERNKERNHKDYRDERHYNRDSNYHPNDYSRYNGNRKRWSYH